MLVDSFPWDDFYVADNQRAAPLWVLINIPHRSVRSHDILRNKSSTGSKCLIYRQNVERLTEIRMCLPLIMVLDLGDVTLFRLLLTIQLGSAYEWYVGKGRSEVEARSVFATTQFSLSHPVCSLSH